MTKLHVELADGGCFQTKLEKGIHRRLFVIELKVTTWDNPRIDGSFTYVQALTAELCLNIFKWLANSQSLLDIMVDFQSNNNIENDGILSHIFIKVALQSTYGCVGGRYEYIDKEFFIYESFIGSPADLWSQEQLRKGIADEKRFGREAKERGIA